jgi:hypothetical protein
MIGGVAGIDVTWPLDIPSPMERGANDIDPVWLESLKPGEAPLVIGVQSPEDPGVNNVNEGGQKPDSSHVKASVVVEV